MSLGAVAAIALFTLILLAINYVNWCLSYWKRKGVQTMKPQFLLGNAKDIFMVKNNIGMCVHQLTEYYKKQHVPFCGYYFSIKPIFVPIQIDLIKKILISDFQHFTDHALTNDKLDPLSSHLFAARGSKWKLLRTKLSPAFTKAKSKMMFPTIKSCVDTLLEVLGDGSTIDIKDLSSRLIMDILASCAFGIQIDTLKHAKSDFQYYAKKFFSPSLKNVITQLFMISFPKVLITLRVKTIQDDITNYFLKTVENVIRHREANNIIRNDLIHLLLQIKNNVKIEDDKIGNVQKTKDQSDCLTLTEITAQCFVFLIAGFESSSSLISFCLYELCLDESLQERAREDIVNAISQHNGEITYETLLNTQYLSKCVKETARKYPILPFLFRTCTKTYKVPDSDLVIDKGTTCFISVLSLHYDKEMYPNPEKFDPERFSEENIFKRHSLSWIPFGEGPRICIAYPFGLLQVKLALATLLLNYKFSLNPKTKIPLVMDPRSFVTRATDDIFLNIKKI